MTTPTPAMWDFHRLEARIVALEAEVAALKAARPVPRTLADVVALHPSRRGLPDGAA